MGDDIGSASEVNRKRNAKHVTRACEQCRKAKSKCTGTDPCSRCSEKQLPCQFSDQIDARARVPLKRKIDEVESENNSLRDIVDALRYGNDGHVLQIVTLVRDGASLDRIQMCVAQQVEENETDDGCVDPEADIVRTSSRPSGMLQQRPSKVLGVLQLIDNPPYGKNARNWTTITDDDSLLSNLISVLFIWEGTFYNWIDRDLFLGDMSSGQTRYCSRFLVNALLAFACPYSDRMEARPKNGQPSSLMSKFMAEAQRLLESQPVSLPTVQGIACLCMAKVTLGQDRLGHEDLCLATSICEKLLRSDTGAIHLRALRTCVWGLYSLDISASFIIRMPPSMSQPDLRLPAIPKDEEQIDPYPLRHDQMCFSIQELLHYRSTLAIIMRDVVTFICQPQSSNALEIEEKTKDCMDIHSHLLEWHDALPEHLLIRDNPPPSVFMHQGHYLSVVMALLNYSPAAEELTERRVQIATEVASLCRMYLSLYEGAPASVSFSDAAFKALLVLTDHNDASHESAMLDLCIMLRAISRRFPVALAMFQMFRVSIQQKGIELPVSVTKQLEDFAKYDKAEAILKHIVSLYPAYTADDAVTNMEEFYLAINGLELEDKPAQGVSNNLGKDLSSPTARKQGEEALSLRSVEKRL